MKCTHQIEEKDLLDPSNDNPKARTYRTWNTLLAEQKIEKYTQSFPFTLQTFCYIYKWNLPLTCASAVLLEPVLNHPRLNEQALVALFGTDALLLAKSANAWRNFYPNIGDSSTATEPNLFILQWLFRQLYLDYPNFNLFYLIIARHHAELELVKSPAVARETLAIYLPLVDMLGVWFLHRCWLDAAYEILEPAHFKNLKTQTGPLKDSTPPIAKQTEQNPEKNIPDTPTQTAEATKSMRDKTLTFTALETTLHTHFQRENIHPTPRVLTYPVSAGSVMHLIMQSEAEEELLERVVVRILCHTREDCYKVLGIIHSLGKPVTPRFSTRFDDCIADPQSNGYQALHTGIMFRRPGGGIKLVMVRILTPLMHRMNETGIFMLTTHRHARRISSLEHFWWSQIKNKLTESLHLLNPILKHQQFQHWLATAEPGGITNPTYVFTPRGEIMLLAPNSTALDYAYFIHTELGHHASKIKVNSNPVSYNYPLRNGDLVLVENDPLSPGPDLSWLSQVSTAKARIKIKHHLTQQAAKIHPGRVILLKALFQRLEKQTGYFRTHLTTAQLDSFLDTTARTTYSGSLSRLYNHIRAKPERGFELAHNLACMDLTHILQDVNGHNLDNGEYNLTFCPHCQPTPGHAIIGVIHKKPSHRHNLTIHTRDKCKFAKITVPWRIIPVQWTNSTSERPHPPEAQTEDMVLFEIHAETRNHLLGDALSIIYAQSNAKLHRVEAQEYPNGSAIISLTVSLAMPGITSLLQRGLENLRGVRRCSSIPVAYTVRMALTENKEQADNPFLEREAYSRLDFYNREDKVQAILDWISGMERKPAILHGQKRVGKTSLAKYLAFEILRHNQVAFPVLVDLQLMSTYSATRLANLLVHTVFAKIRAPIPEQRNTEEPAVWAIRALKEASQHLNGRKILVILDEFNALLIAEQHADLEDAIFRNLRAIMAEDINISWLLIMQDSEYMTPSLWGSARQIIQQAHSIPLTNLSPAYARKLILEPMKSYRINFITPDIPDEIIRISAGNPYLIKLLCSFLVDAAKNQNITSITHADLEEAVINLLSEGERFFDHFRKELTAPQMDMLHRLNQHILRTPQSGYTQFLQSLAKTKQYRHSETHIEESIDAMHRQGILIINRQKNTIQFAVPLFQRWLNLK